MLSIHNSAHAQTLIPGSVDAGRIEARPNDILPDKEKRPLTLPQAKPAIVAAPDAAEHITFVLNDVSIEGLRAFDKSDIADIYKPLIGLEIPLSRAWEIAGRITERYHAAGYFLSRAFVPPQEIDGGILSVNVVEGYIGEIEIRNTEKVRQPDDNALIETIKAEIMALRPIKMRDLESALLRLNDLHGLKFRSVLGRMGDEESNDERAQSGAVKLFLEQEKTSGSGSIMLNNYGSRFVGPHRLSFAYSDSFFQNHSTTLSGLSSLPNSGELWALNIGHDIQISPEVGINFAAGLTVSNPGFTLKVNDIESRSENWAVQLNWQPIRQRQENLSLTLGIDARNVNTDILSTPLTRDRIRAARLGLSYDRPDPFNGYNTLSAILSRGLSVFGANEAGDINLSRANADPNFTKTEVSWQRTRFINAEWLSIMNVRGQHASHALFSAEEFGFGGPAFGRAYDPSEITGDHGIGASVDIQYLGLDPVRKFNLVPYGFYEIGKIWNIDNAQSESLSMADIGFGVNINHPSGVRGNFTIAQPLTKAIDTPIYGGNGKNPRLYFQLGWGF